MESSNQSSNECLVCGIVSKDNVNQMVERIRATLNDRAKAFDFGEERTTILKAPKAFSNDAGKRLTVVRTIYSTLTSPSEEEEDSGSGLDDRLVLIDNGVFDRTNSAETAWRRVEKCQVSDSVFQFLNSIGFRIDVEVLLVGRRFCLDNGIVISIYRILQVPPTSETTPLLEKVKKVVEGMKAAFSDDSPPPPSKGTHGLSFVTATSGVVSRGREPQTKTSDEDSPWFARVSLNQPKELDVFNCAETLRSYCNANLAPLLVELPAKEMSSWN